MIVFVISAALMLTYLQRVIRRITFVHQQELKLCHLWQLQADDNLAVTKVSLQIVLKQMKIDNVH